LNHSATHLLHAALRDTLGDHVTQKGSLVDAQRLRFDFSHFEPVNDQQLQTIERLVNEHIRSNHAVETNLMDLEEAKTSGAMALFGEKYDEKVRVLRMSDFSVELCGGTHAERTGDIGLLKITSEVGIASGVRRIEAVTGETALNLFDSEQQRILNIANALKAKPDTVEEKAEQLVQRNRQLEKELDALKSKLASSAGNDLSSQAQQIAGLNVLAAQLDGADTKSLRDTVDQLKDKLAPAAIVLAATEGEKITLIAGVSKEATDKLKAGNLVSHVAQQVGGKGGGRPDMAQGGGSQPENLTSALDSVYDWVNTQSEQ